MMAPLDDRKKKVLVSLMVLRNLRKVVGAYEKYPEARELKIPRTGDTALHVAVTDERETYVERMVAAAGNDVLLIANEQGDTALHLAAKFGNAYICKCIAQKDVALIGIQNKFGETPLFSAVSRGKTEAFLYIYHLCKDKAPESLDQIGSCTRKNGDTILHSAISGEYFDVAYIIIKKYPELVHQANKDGLLPLHLLATKPSVFPSGLQLFGIRKFIYRCVCVRKLAKITDLEKAPNPQLRWNAHWRPVERVTCLSMAADFLQLIENSRGWYMEPEERTFSLRGHGEIDLEVEEAANAPDSDDCFTPGVVVGLVLLSLLLFLLFLPLYIAVFFCCFCPYVLLRITFGFGYEEYVRLKHIKEKCVWSVEVMNNLIESEHAYEQSRMQPEPPKEEDKSPEATSKIVEKPIFLAAKHGMLEMVSRILDFNPEAIFDVNTEKKNIVMLAVEHRQHRLYDDLSTNERINRTILEHVDEHGNSLLHIAAKLQRGKQFWRIRGAALHVHMEIKWYELVKKSTPSYFIDRQNKDHKTPEEVLQASHQDLIKEGRQWLTDTSQSCSLVAALIATVAFATSATIPGGLKQDNGVPSLEHMPIFIVSASASLVALSSSMISVVMFLGILTSSFTLKDFRKDLPYKLLLGLMSLLVSIVSMIISFFAGHHFVLKQEFNQNALVYELLCSFLVVYIILKFPLNFEIVLSTLRTKPPK